MTRIFYEKVGGRYKPLAEYDSDLMSALTKGTHLIMCYPGGRSTKYDIDPALAPMIAAGRYASQAISDKLYQASKAKPSRVAVTPEQRQAWNDLCTAFGEELYSIQFPCINDIAEAGVAAMQQEADKLLKNPVVRRAYEDFILLCKLTLEEQA